MYALFLALSISLLIFMNAFYIKTAYFSPQTEQHIVTRIIDGDTLVIDGNTTVRLLNINSPEKNDPLSNLSKAFLEQYLNSTLKFKFTGKDKYDRSLARIYAQNYLNLYMVEQGMASKFLVDSSELKTFEQAEKQAIENEKGIWKKSPYYGCFSMQINAKEERVTIRSRCGIISFRGYKIKDESRKIYSFNEISSDILILHSEIGKDNSTDLYWNSKTDVWNNDDDALYLFDNQERIAAYESYSSI